MTTRQLVEKVTARVFCHGPGGGNPLTVFWGRQPLSEGVQTRLATSCDWESVMVTSEEDLPTMAFWLPSGEPVSFCAHAALGGAFCVGQNPLDKVRFRVAMTGEEQSVELTEEADATSGKALLRMQATFEEAPVSHSPSLRRLLREHLKIKAEDLIPPPGTKQWPTFVNASIARPKTLVCLPSEDALAQVRPPKVAGHSSRTSFAAACGAIDDSTGLYVYAAKASGGWECRQFPKASGYPEDPATGIAAAALAGSLYHQGEYLRCYQFYQGRTMGRPSLIEVLDFSLVGGTKASFGLQGRVEIDSRETIEVQDEEN